LRGPRLDSFGELAKGQTAMRGSVPQSYNHALAIVI